MWDIKLKLRHRHTTLWWLPKGMGVTGGQYMVIEDDLNLGGGHTMQYTDHVSEKYTLETYMILLTNVTPINLIKI